MTEFSTWDIREWERPIDDALRGRPNIERRYTKHPDGRYTITAISDGKPIAEVELVSFDAPGCRPRMLVKSYDL